MNAISAFDTNQPLGDAPINPAWIVSGEPRARNRVLFRSTDKSAWTMLWDCSAGEFTWTYRFDEVIHFLEGGVTITLPQGQPRDFGPGDVIFFPAGTVAHWRVDRYIKKLAFCQNPVPSALNVPMKLVRRIARPFARAMALLAGLLADPALPDLEREPPASSVEIRHQV